MVKVPGGSTIGRDAFDLRCASTHTHAQFLLGGMLIALVTAGMYLWGQPQTPLLQPVSHAPRTAHDPQGAAAQSADTGRDADPSCTRRARR